MDLICQICKKDESEVKKIINYENNHLCYFCILKCETILSEAMNNFHDEESEIIRNVTGVPKNLSPTRISYNNVTETTIIEVLNNPERNYYSRLYVKRNNEAKYTLLDGQKDGLSYSNVVTSCNQPFMVFQVTISHRLIYGGGYETFKGFYRVDLRNYKIEKLIDGDEINLPEPYTSINPYVFINSSDDGNFIYCGCHLKITDEEGGSFICKVDVITKNVEIITELKGVWF
jgi:hypothetical protein